MMPITQTLILHIGAGAMGIVFGAAALSVHKGDRLHRAFGTVFFLSMLTMSALGVYLAGFGSQPTAGAAPPTASVAVGILTLYLVTTAWMTVRRKSGSVGVAEYGAIVLALTTLIALLAFGLQAAINAPDQIAGYAPYFVFAALAAFASAFDVKVIRQGGIAGVPRIARHLWRMCVALFFAAAFFFLGQQKVMPSYMHGSPILIVLAFFPLALMTYWLFRVRLISRFKEAPAGS